jgi:hypothetical protein
MCRPTLTAILSVLLSTSAFGQGYLKIDGKYQPIRGINAPLINGHFLSNLKHPAGWTFDPVWLDKVMFSDMEWLHANVVRTWVFAFDDDQASNGLLFDKQGYVTGIDPMFLTNLEVCLNIAQKHKVSLYFCVCIPVSVTKSKQRDIFTIEKARNAYFRNGIGPFVRWLKDKPAVFAIDLANEPEWGPERGQHWQPYSMPVVRAFIEHGITTVKRADPKRLVSFGGGGLPVGDPKCYEWMQGLNIDFLDLHVYDDQGDLPEITALNPGIPVLLGEFGDENAGDRSRNDVVLNRSVTNFLNNASRKGYAGTFFWEYPSITGGMGRWRPVSYIIRDFYAQGSWGSVKKTPTKRRATNSATPDAIGPAYLVDLPRIGLVHQNGWWSDRGELVLGGLSGNPMIRKPLVFEGKPSEHGIYMHARPSGEATITYRLGKSYNSFRSEVLIPEMLPQQGDPRTPLILKVVGDGRTLWQSKPLGKKGDHQACSVSVRGIDELSLRVECRGPENWGLAAWVEPRLSVSGPDMGHRLRPNEGDSKNAGAEASPITLRLKRQ